MAANTDPIFALTPKMAYAEITGTTTDKTGGTTTNMVTLVTAGSNGTKISQIGFKCEGTSTAGLFMIFITNTSGTSPKLFDEIVISAVTSSTTVATNRAMNSYSDLELASGQLIQVGATTLSANIEAWAQQGDF
ncbi:MAG TPA: hypothetical protein VK806_00180 [Bacteroidia bacterium]|jgi:hypothetical protein|nr:hypothetical protein [Bacteroidia bacterium]